MTSPGQDAGDKRKQATLYDAVAGRVGYEGFLGAPDSATTRDTITTSATAIPPDEVLFRREGAPVRYEEDDIYAADRHLKPHEALPDSDLLKTIHAYAADFYFQNGPAGRHSLNSMDETALLAMGILLEEAAAEALGKTGDLALLEPANSDQMPVALQSAVELPARASRKRSTAGRSTSRSMSGSRVSRRKRQQD